MAFIDGMAPHATSSMQRDILSGKPSELEAVLGVICRLGRRRATATPTADAIYGSLTLQEERARLHHGLPSFNAFAVVDVPSSPAE